MEKYKNICQTYSNLKDKGDESHDNRMRREPIKQDSQCAGRDRQKDGLPGRTSGGADIYKKLYRLHTTQQIFTAGNARL